MKNEEDKIETDEIANLEQFQVARSKQEEDTESQQDDTGYTPEEEPFADGKNTELAAAFDEEDPETLEDESDEEDEDFEEQGN